MMFFLLWYLYIFYFFIMIMNGLIDISDSWGKVVQDEEMKIFSQYHILKTLKTYLSLCVCVCLCVCLCV